MWKYALACGIMTSTCSASRASVLVFTRICAANDAAATLPCLWTDLGIGFWAPVVVGDFTARHSYKFLRHLLPGHPIVKSDWKKVYKVRGRRDVQYSDRWIGW
jgi:hypothetical protein